MQYKALGEKAMEQVADEQLFTLIDKESNSLYLMIKHLSGNMLSRWTDFLTTDGEKPWRIRDEEFEQENNLTREHCIGIWEKGWACLFNTLNQLTDANLGDTIYIRGEAHSVLEAINRQVAHYSYHVGQMVFLAKHLNHTSWQTLSIAKNQSQQFNHNMNHLLKP